MIKETNGCHDYSLSFPACESDGYVKSVRDTYGRIFETLAVHATVMAYECMCARPYDICGVRWKTDERRKVFPTIRENRVTDMWSDGESEREKQRREKMEYKKIPRELSVVSPRGTLENWVKWKFVKEKNPELDAISIGSRRM